jgi:HD-GYP domain-containing protein (c-di-GMP phosphodiesterase class II)
MSKQDPISPKALFLGPTFFQVRQLTSRCSGLGYTLQFSVTIEQAKEALEAEKSIQEVKAIFASFEFLKVLAPLLPNIKVYTVGGSAKLEEALWPEGGPSLSGRIDSFDEVAVFLRILKSLKTDFQKGYLDRDDRKAAQDRIDQEIQSGEKDFVPIRLAQFVSGSVCMFDVYIKLSDTKYIKILNSKAPFDRTRIERFSQKGVQELYLRTEDQEHYLRYCASVSTRLVESSAPASRGQIEQTLNFGAETLNFLKEGKANSHRLEFAEKFVSNVQSLVKKMGLDNSSLQPFLEDLHSYDHGVSTSMISAMLAFEMGIRSEKPVELVGLAAILHDIGLTKISPDLKVLDYRLLDPVQQEEFLRHGDYGRKIADSLKGLHPTIVQAIEWHHCRKFNPTLDKRITVKTDINWVTEIIGFSDEFLRLIPKIKAGERVTEDIKVFVQGTFSVDILTAAHKLFPDVLGPT